MNQPEKTTRREVLGALAAAPLAALGAGKAAAEHPPEVQKKFQPEEHWRKRITPPEDGKRYGWFVDTRRCFGCHGCEVACKAENDVPLGHFIRQTIYKDVGVFPRVKRHFLPVTCQHCEEAPCIKACPCGALHKGPGGSVVVDYNICSGHGACVEVCPYGAIYLDPVAGQAVKCHNCYHRLEVGMEPACVATCPAQALYFGDLNDPNSKVVQAMKQAEQQGETLVQLRPQRGTKPRTWYAGEAVRVAEDRVPQEGESLGVETYNIHRWKEEEKEANESPT